jgi:hypothetical protein
VATLALFFFVVVVLLIPYYDYCSVVLSLHQNNITDDAGNLICKDNSKLELLTVDCGDIPCPCCDECCDGEGCFGNVLWETLENADMNWEEHFERSDYSFNPRITMGKV